MVKYALLASAVLSVGCGFGRPPATPVGSPTFVAINLPTPEGLSADPPQARRVLPGDILLVRTYSAEEGELPGITVDELGMVHLPLVGTVEVGGLTLPEAEARIQTSLRTMDRVVRVGLEIADARGHMATVLGAVGTAGRVAIGPGMRVADLLAAVGGPLSSLATEANTPRSDIGGAFLVRDGERLPISIRQALEGAPRHNVRVRAGDHLYVPFQRGQDVIVLGAVDDAGVVSYHRGIRLSEVLARSGGLNERGDRSDVTIIRGDLEAPEMYTASLSAIVSGEEVDVELAPGDVVYVSEEWTYHVGEVLGRLGSILSNTSTLGLGIGLAVTQ